MNNLAINILRNAAETPDRIATQSGTTSLTYTQLDAQVRKAAYVLRDRGVSDGSVVGIALRDGQQTVVAMLSIWLLGGTCGLIDFRTPGNDKKSLSEAHNFAVLLEDRNQPDDGYPGLSLSQWSKELAAAPMAQISPPADAGIAFLSFTSGTTGTPASVELSHDAVIFRWAILTEVLTGDFNQRYLSAAPLSFGGSYPYIVNTLLLGGSVIFFPPLFRPRDLAEAFEKYRITGCSLVPTILRDLLGYLREIGKSLATPDTPLRLVTHGAAIQPAELKNIQELLTPNVFQVYGTHPAGCLASLDLRKEPTKIDTVGRPLRGVEVEIVDPHGKPLPAMTVGEIRIKSRGCSTSLKGRNKEAGSDYIIGDWYYGGDLGLIDEDGYLKLVGRTTDVIIRSGINVYPQEVEAALSDFPGVRQAAAVGYPDERTNEEIAVFAVADPNVDVEELRRHCNARLAPDKRPKRILIIPEMPLNANGKIAKQKLLELLANA